MKLKYNLPHNTVSKSINIDIKPYLNKLDFPDLSIITGINGSGKTHLLEEIEFGSIRIESNGIENYGPRKYFSYSSFFLQDQANKNHITDRRQRRNWTNEKDKIISQISNDMSYLHKGYLLDINTNTYVHKNKNYDAGLIFYLMIDALVNNKDEIIKIVTANINTPDRNNLSIIFDKAYAIFTKLKKYLSEIDFQNNFSIQKFTSQDIYERYLGEHLFLDIKKYYEGKSNFIYKYMNSELHLSKDRYIDKQQMMRDFKTKYGENPITVFNDVLREYSCNGYLFNTSDFDSLSYEGISKQDFKLNLRLYSGEIKINFSSLSSGEKILLALASLMNRYNRIKYNSPGVLLLDEIDASLHSSMINNLLNVLKNVFIKKYGLKIILVTHSPTMIALAPEDSIFVMRRSEDEGDRISKESKANALKTLTEGFLTFGEGIDILRSKKPLVYVEGKTDVKYIKKAAEFNDNGKNILNKIKLSALGGKEQLKTHFSILHKAVKLFKNNESPISINKCIFLFDCDADIEEKYKKHTLFKRKINRISENKIQKGIENLFGDTTLEKACKFKPAFIDIYPKRENIIRGESKTDLGEWIVNTNEKTNLCNWLCANGTQEDFKNFSTIFSMIGEIISES